MIWAYKAKGKSQEKVRENGFSTWEVVSHISKPVQTRNPSDNSKNIKIHLWDVRTAIILSALYYPRG